MNTDQLLGQSKALIQWLDEQLHGAEFRSEVRTQLAGSCLDLAMEHQKAIVMLVSQSLHGSAFALVRAIFETYIRGAWLYHCASDADLELFQDDKFDQKKKIGRLIGDLEKFPGFDRGVLSKVKTEWFNTMCSSPTVGIWPHAGV